MSKFERVPPVAVLRAPLSSFCHTQSTNASLLFHFTETTVLFPVISGLHLTRL